MSQEPAGRPVSRLAEGGRPPALRVAIDAVRLASRLCRSVRHELVAADQATKSDSSPVTVADLGSQALISLLLADAFPDDPIMGEEDASLIRSEPDGPIAAAVHRQVSALRQDVAVTDLIAALDRCDHSGGREGRFWTLDPVDGTKGFLRGGQYAVALALIQDGEAVLGVLGCPNMGEGAIFGAIAGEGAQTERLDPPVGPSSIHVSRPTDVRDAVWAESVESGHSDQGTAAAIARQLGLRSAPVRMDSQAKYGAVARGDAAIYLRLPTDAGYRENIWDHAAGSLLVREAGGEVTDIDGLALDLGAGRQFIRHAGVVATSGGALHIAVLDAIRSVQEG